MNEEIFEKSENKICKNIENIVCEKSWEKEERYE